VFDFEQYILGRNENGTSFCLREALEVSEYCKYGKVQFDMSLTKEYFQEAQARELNL